MNRRVLFPVVACAALALACAKTEAPEAPPKPAGLQPYPERLAFLCVTPGCDTTESVRIHINGNRRVAIKRILLAGDAAAEFTFTPSEQPPFIVGANADFDVQVRYAPQGAPIPGAAELRITYTDASAEESPERLEPGELVIPLVRRLVGQPILKATPERVLFGVVPQGETRSVPLTVENAGFGNIALELSKVESTHADVAVNLPDNAALAPGAKVEVPVQFSPQSEGYVRGEIVLSATAAELPPVKVPVEGTSLSVPRAAFDPEGDIDFGLLKRTKQRTVTPSLVNQGGVDLVVQSITVTDTSGSVTVDAPNAGTGIVVPPLERVALPIRIDGQVAGPVDAVISVTSNDPVTPVLELRVQGTVTEPELTAAPALLDFGTIPVGWVVTLPVELRNTGYGPLTIKNVKMVSGSSTLFTLASIPALPRVLERDERIAVDVQFRAETAATFSGWLSVESDDPGNEFAEVPITGTVGSCDAACPISNGTPSCTSGTCDVGSCNDGWFNTDKSAATGCECAEVGTDPGEFCEDSADKGTLKDNSKDQASHSGVLPTETDVDVIRFWAEDAFAFFDENFKVKIRLDSADPSIKMCVYRHDGAHANECYWTNEVCPANRYYQRNGSGSSGDDADFIIKVYRDASVAPSCASYTVFMSNGI